MKKNIIITLFGLLAFNFSAHANKVPKNGFIDGRIKIVNYNNRDVVSMTAHYGFSTMIEFSKSEIIETISLGDTLAWNILDVKNKIFIKPVEDHAETNMQVVTNKRVYNFALIADKALSHHSKKLTFTLRFHYPQEALKLALLRDKAREREALPRPEEIVQNHTFDSDDVNMEYTFRGDKEHAPRRVFDDGEFTYFYFNEVTETPAIFVSDINSEEEALVNFHKKGKYIVVQRLARKFVLRHGDSVTCIYNEHFKPDFEQIIHMDTVETPTEDQRLTHIE